MRLFVLCVGPNTQCVSSGLGFEELRSTLPPCELVDNTTLLVALVAVCGLVTLKVTHVTITGLTPQSKVPAVG